jgi:integration host factor subunit alpha
MQNTNSQQQEQWAVAPAAVGALIKTDLATLLAERIGLNRRDAKELVEVFFDEIRHALERGEEVRLYGFGNFNLRDKASRPGRNPGTGLPAPIRARRVVTFHPSLTLRNSVADAAPQRWSKGGAGAQDQVQARPEFDDTVGRNAEVGGGVQRILVHPNEQA